PMSSGGARTVLVLYSPRGAGAVERLEAIRKGLPEAEVTALAPLELDGPSGKTFDYNSKMQLKGQPLSFTLLGCNGAVHTAAARQTLLKGAHGILVCVAADGAADVGSLESALVGDFDRVAGRNYALGVVTDDSAIAEASRG